jgi:hypothetical protein
LVCPIEAAVEIDPVACNFHLNSSPLSPGPAWLPREARAAFLQHEHNINKYTVYVKDLLRFRPLMEHV